MRMIVVAAAAILAAAPAAVAQTGTPPQTPEAAQPQAQQAPTVTKVDVVDITELPPEVQTRVTAATSERTEAELDSLRASIDSHQMASAALRAEGIGSESVIAVAMSPDGTLTLITRKS